MPDTHQASTRSIDTLLRYAAIVLTFLTPFFVITTPWASVPQSKALLASAVIVIALIVWLIGILIRRRIAFSVDPILIAAFLIPIAYAISAFAAGSPLSSFVSGDALIGSVASVLILFGSALIGVIAVEDRRQAFTLIVTLLISAAIVILFQVARLFVPGYLGLNGAMAGNTSSVVGSWHDLSIFTAAILLIVLGFLETSVTDNRLMAIFLQILAGVSFALLVVINFSDTWLVLSGFALLFAIARFIRGYKRTRGLGNSLRSAILWIIFAGIALGAGLSGSFIFSHLPASLQISQVEVRPSWQGTFQAGQGLLSNGKALVFGTGPNTFDQQWALFKPKEVNATNFWNTEFQSGVGIVPTALVTVGILGTLGWVLLALGLLYAGYRSMLDESEGRLRVILYIACGLMMVFHVIYVPTMGLSIIMFLLLGILAGLNAGSWREIVLKPSIRPISIFAVLLVVSVGAITASIMESRAIASTLITSRAADLYQKSGDINATSALIAQAIHVDPQNDIAQRAAVEVGLLQLAKLAQTNAASTTQEQLKSALSTTIAHGLAAVSIDNSNYQNWLALAGLYQSLAGQGIQGAYEQAEAAWQRAASTTPANPLPHIQLGQIALAKNDFAGAKSQFSTAISLKPDIALPYYLRSQIEANQASTEEQWKAAIQDAVAAAQLAAQDPLGWYNLGVILYAAGDINDAGASFEKAVSIQNNYSDALFALAIIYDKVGAHENAIAAAQKVLELNPNSTLIQAILLNLQGGKPALDGLQGQPSSATSTKQTSQRK